MSTSTRVIIAANRLPVRINPSDLDAEPTPACGGLATALRHFHEAGNSIWIGWSGDAPQGEPSGEFAAHLARRRLVGVALPEKTSQRYYDGMCNAVLWPLLHSQAERIRFRISDWDAYRLVNEQFALTIAREYRPGDTIWVHDYHLMLVPKLLRALLPAARIGFFLHVPFPSLDVFRMVPWRREIVDGIRGADVIGFHTRGYAAHFEDASSALGTPMTDGEPITRHHVDVYPIGVDVESFGGSAACADADALPEVQSERCRVLLGVDRLDYTKGIPLRLRAYDRLLRMRPDLRGRVRLLQIAVPSRERVASYRRLRREVEELVGRINGEHGSVDWTPIHYLRQSISRPQLIALYRRADLMLVTPVRDGMNLVAKEFVAARTDGDGVLVLSEFAGAAEALSEAVTVNPHSVDQLVTALSGALEMPPFERRRRMAALRASVTTQDVHWWASRFLTDLNQSTPDVRREPRRTARARFFSSIAEVGSTVRARLATRWGRRADAIASLDQPRHIGAVHEPAA